MELDITDFVLEAEPFDFSASVAERGQTAGPDTWRNAMRAAKQDWTLADSEQIDDLKDWFGEFGAWDRDEIKDWDAEHCNALLIQFISGDLREAESLCSGDGPGGVDWAAYEALSQQGTVSGRMFLGDGDRVYFYVGS